MRGTHQEPKAEDLGARVRAVRELAGLEQRDVAKAAGMGRRELQAIERGAKRVDDTELGALAGALGVDPDVLVGVGFEGDLVRAGSVGEQIDQVVGHDSDRWHDLPTTVEGLPPALPANLPHPERRKDFATRNHIEQSWREVRVEMGDTLTSCARLISAGPGDDVRRLIERLERDLHQLRSQHAFQRNLAEHERTLERVRGTGGRRPVMETTVSAADVG